MMPYLIEIFTVPVVVVHSSLDNRVVFKYFDYSDLFPQARAGVISSGVLRLMKIGLFKKVLADNIL